MKVRRAQPDEMLSRFRALGGIATNITPGPQDRGGLFPIDASQPVMLRVPENLIVPVEDITFAGERVAIKDTAAAGESERAFFDLYANAFSWGGRGRSDAAHFIGELEALPDEVRAILTAAFGMGELLEGDRENQFSAVSCARG